MQCKIASIREAVEKLNREDQRKWMTIRDYGSTAKEHAFQRFKYENINNPEIANIEVCNYDEVNQQIELRSGMIKAFISQMKGLVQSVFGDAAKIIEKVED